MNGPMEPTDRRRARGFTLVEVLVAILIIAIGLLGMAGLQVASLKYNQTAYLRAQATQLAYDLSDRMRANSAALAAYLGSGTADDCVANGCSPAQMAGYDLTQWTSAVAEQLPGGAGSVSQAAGIYTISVSWIEREQTGDVAQTFVTTLEP